MPHKLILVFELWFAIWCKIMHINYFKFNLTQGPDQKILKTVIFTFKMLQYHTGGGGGGGGVRGVPKMYQITWMVP